MGAGSISPWFPAQSFRDETADPGQRAPGSPGFPIEDVGFSHFRERGAPRPRAVHLPGSGGTSALLAWRLLGRFFRQFDDGA
jgi:hypothetical protein